MRRACLSPRCAVAVCAALWLVAAGPVAADSGRRLQLPASPERELYRTECGACHVAFPPALLPPASWRAQLDGLARHYGSDASLDPAARDRLAAWLPAQAEHSRTGERPPEDRLTRATWFQREHREARLDRKPGSSAASFARCEACHTRAPEGAFDEHDLRTSR